MTPASLSLLLNRNVEAVCRHLYPQGRRVGREWTCGDVQGEPGDSFKIVVEGDKVGVACDFATEQTFGDLLDVWQARCSVGLAEAMAQACSFLGVVPDAKESRPDHTYTRPQRPHSVHRLSQDGKVYAYLKSRGLTDAALDDFRIAEDGDWIVFPYLHEDKLFNIKYLHIERPEGKKQVRQEKNAEPGLFGWVALEKQFGNSRLVVISEGEIDSMTLHQCGIPALSIPNGGGGGHKQDWIEVEYDRLERFDTIYLCLDNDEPGQAATKEIIKRIGAERCRIVNLPHKDANECFQHGIRDFKKYLLSAKTLDPAELKSADHFTQAVLNKFYPAPGAYVGMKTPWAQTQGKLLFRKPELVVWTGFSGSGKSSLLNFIITRGLLDGERFVVASLEMPSRVTLWQMVRQLNGMELPSTQAINATMAWLKDKLWMIDIVKSVTPDKLLSIFKYAYRRYGINNFVTDSLLKCGIDEKDLDGQKQFADKLVELSNECEATTHLVAHSRKQEDEYSPPNKFDVRGAAAITDSANTVLSVWRNRSPNEQQNRKESYKKNKQSTQVEEDQCDTLLTVLKQRENGWEGKIKLYYSSESLQFQEDRKLCYTNYLSMLNNAEPPLDDTILF